MVPKRNKTAANPTAAGQRRRGGACSAAVEGRAGAFRISARAAAKLSIEAKRSAGFLAIALRQIASRRGSRPGRRVDGGAGESLTIFARIEVKEPWNGMRPVNNS